MQFFWPSHADFHYDESVTKKTGVGFAWKNGVWCVCVLCVCVWCVCVCGCCVCVVCVCVCVCE